MDVSQHSVPLDQIYFDTFQPTNRAVALSEAPAELIVQLRDAIPPIHQPKYESASDATWLTEDDIVIGYVADEHAWAYPVRILNFHEIVNDVLAGEPVLITYCPLCYSGIVFSRQLDSRVLTFGNTSALYESDMVMLDYETGSYWWQVAGEAIVGPLTGDKMTILPSVMTRWGGWRDLFPDTKVLSRETGYNPSSYDRDPFLGYEASLDNGNFAFPVSEAGKDGRLPPSTKVLVLKFENQVKGYPLTVSQRTAVMDNVGGQDVVVFVEPQGPAGSAFLPVTSDRTLNFEVSEGQIIDRETNSVWNIAGQAIEGELSGARLSPVPSRTSFWFAIVAAEPEITLYSSEKQ